MIFSYAANDCLSGSKIRFHALHESCNRMIITNGNKRIHP